METTICNKKCAKPPPSQQTSHQHTRKHWFQHPSASLANGSRQKSQDTVQTTCRLKNTQKILYKGYNCQKKLQESLHLYDQKVTKGSQPCRVGLVSLVSSDPSWSQPTFFPGDLVPKISTKASFPSFVSSVFATKTKFGKFGGKGKREKVQNKKQTKKARFPTKSPC